MTANLVPLVSNQPHHLREFLRQSSHTEESSLQILLVKEVKDGALCNVAPTILKLMGIPQPAAMTAEPLI